MKKYKNKKTSIRGNPENVRPRNNFVSIQTCLHTSNKYCVETVHFLFFNISKQLVLSIYNMLRLEINGLIHKSHKLI